MERLLYEPTEREKERAAKEKEKNERRGRSEEEEKEERGGENRSRQMPVMRKHYCALPQPINCQR